MTAGNSRHSVSREAEDDGPLIVMNEQFTKEHCELAIDACQRLADLRQHPMSAASWRGMERLWRERLKTAEASEQVQL